VDLGGVVLDEAAVAVISEMVEPLVLIERPGVGHERMDRVSALRGALHERAFSGRVLGQVVQPPRVIVLVPSRGIAAAHVCRAWDFMPCLLSYPVNCRIACIWGVAQDPAGREGSRQGLPGTSTLISIGHW